MNVTVDLALRSSLLLGAALVADAALARSKSSAARRHAIWLGSFGALALLPLYSWMLPSLPIAILPIHPATRIGFSPASAIAASAPVAADFSSLLLSFYLAVTALLVTRLAIGRILLERQWQRAAPADSILAGLTHSVATQLGLIPSIAIRFATDVLVPMTWGSLKPRVVLPDEARSWTDERVRRVLLHELGHVARQDSLVRLGVEVVCAFYWVHPGVWLAARRLRLVQEQACDDLALGHGVPPIDYARDLLDTAGAFSKAHVALAMAAPTDLERRLRAILGDPSRATSGLVFRASALLMVAAVAPLTAVVQLVPGRSMAATLPDRTLPQLVAIKPASSIRTEPPASSPVRVRRRLAPFAMPNNWLPTTPRTPEAMDHDARLARYSEDVQDYHRNLERYSVNLGEYGTANEDYQRKVDAFYRRVAEIGPHPPPSVTLPTYPTAPTAPTYPTAPTAPVRPPQPH